MGLALLANWWVGYLSRRQYMRAALSLYQGYSTYRQTSATPPNRFKFHPNEWAWLPTNIATKTHGDEVGDYRPLALCCKRPIRVKSKINLLK
jgi:hypothetical protein